MLNQLDDLAPDPLLSLIEKVAADSRKEKIDLGVGVYKDEHANTPVLEAVKLAEQHILTSELSKSYVGALGNRQFNQLMVELVLGKTLASTLGGRVSAIQTAGGCGALRTASELFARANAQGTVWVSDPTWANHVPLIGRTGLKIAKYPYYDFNTNRINFTDMLAHLKKHTQSGDIVLLHGCCHNPCGADLTLAQWQELTALILEKKLIPFIDIAYQGFGVSLDGDVEGVRSIMARVPEAVITVSCSKNFGLYRERVGITILLGTTSNESQRGLGHMANIARGLYSMPPSHGAMIVETILSSSELTGKWQSELVVMRERIIAMRKLLVESMRARGFDRFDFIASQQGMFSFLGVTAPQVAQLASEFGIYMAQSSRISITGLTETNMAYFCDGLASVCG